MELFKDKVVAYLGIENQPDTVNAFCWEVLYNIVEGDGDYDFNHGYLRLTTDFLMGAALLSKFKNMHVYVIEPTAYYSAQAVSMFRCWKLDVPKLSICTFNHFDPSAPVGAVFHHGRRFDLKYDSSCVRTIIQYFDKEDVPQDSRSLSSLVMSTYDD